MSDLANRNHPDSNGSQVNSIENSQKTSDPATVMSGSTDQLDGLAKNAYERRIQRHEYNISEISLAFLSLYAYFGYAPY